MTKRDNAFTDLHQIIADMKALTNNRDILIRQAFPVGSRVTWDDRGYPQRGKVHMIGIGGGRVCVLNTRTEKARWIDIYSWNLRPA